MKSIVSVSFNSSLVTYFELVIYWAEYFNIDFAIAVKDGIQMPVPIQIEMIFKGS